MRKGASGMTFDSYARRILYLHGHYTINTMPKKKIQKRLQIKNSMMNMTQVSISQKTIKDIIFQTELPYFL